MYNTLKGEKNMLKNIFRNKRMDYLEHTILLLKAHVEYQETLINTFAGKVKVLTECVDALLDDKINS